MADASARSDEHDHTADNLASPFVVVGDDKKPVPLFDRSDHSFAIGFAANGSWILSVDSDAARCAAGRLLGFGDRRDIGL